MKISFNENSLNYPISLLFNFITLINYFCNIPLTLFFCYNENLIKKSIINFQDLSIKVQIL